MANLPLRVVKKILQCGGYRKILVTTTPVNLNTTVLTITGREVAVPTPNSIHIGSDVHIECALGKYINHSCSPSTSLGYMGRLIALRDLHIGDEITYNYTFTEPDIHPFKCDQCSGTVAGTRIAPCMRTPLQEPF